MFKKFYHQLNILNILISFSNIRSHLLRLDFDYVNRYKETLSFLHDIFREKLISENPEELKRIGECFDKMFVGHSMEAIVINSVDISIAECYYYQMEMDSALTYLIKSYDPNNINAHKLIIGVVAEHLLYSQDPKIQLDEALKYEGIFKFLREAPVFKSIMAPLHMQVIHSEYESNHGNDGDLLLDSFIDRFPVDSDLKHNPELIGVGFGAASSYYVRRNKYDKALKLLNDGLEYTPASFELKKKKRLLMEEMAR